MSFNDGVIFLLCPHANGRDGDPIGAWKLRQVLSDTGVLWGVESHTGDTQAARLGDTMILEPDWFRLAIDTPITMTMVQPYGWRILYQVDYLDGYRIRYYSQIRQAGGNLDLVPGRWL